MKSTILLLVSALLLSVCSFAQVTPDESEKQDLVILKNGTKIYGKILENVPGKIIKMQTTGGSKMEINYSEVKGVMYDTNQEEMKPTKYPPEKRGRHDRGDREEPSKADKPYNVPGPGIYFATGAQLNYGNYLDFGTFFPFPSLNVATGYRFNKNFAMAAGFELITSDVDVYFSTFGEMVVYFLNSSATPYLSFKSGYMAPVAPFSNTLATFNINPSFGVRLPSKRKVHTRFAIGYNRYNYWQRPFDNNVWGGQWPGNGEYHLISTGFQIEF